MDTAQWPEGVGVVKSMEEKKQIRPQKPQAINCPRCNSTHTKFCYYNNYSLSQPRYFCKTCRRYWTEGGSLRNVPVGGGSRKNKRSSSSSPAAASSSSKISKLIIPDHHDHMGPPITFSHQNPNKINIHDDQGQDLNLAYPQPNSISELADHQLPFNINETKTYPSSTTPQFSAMEFFKSGRIANSGGLMMSSFISMPMPISDHNSSSNPMIYPSTGVPFQEFKPSLNFSLEGFESGVQENGTNTSARLFFPLEELKPSSTTEVLDQQNRSGQDHQDSSGYWNGGLGGGSW